MEKEGPGLHGGLHTLEQSSTHSADSGSDASLVSDRSSSNRGIKLCIGISIALVVIATAVGVAIYMTLVKVHHEEEAVLEILKDLKTEGNIIDQTQDEERQMVVPKEVPLHAPVRLVGGHGDFSGRVLVQWEGQWGTVCGSNWTDNEASAVCRSLGYESGIPDSSSDFGMGTGPIWLSDVRCPEHMASIDDCSTSEWGNPNASCSHQNDVAVTCQGNRANVSQSPAAFYGKSWWYYGSYPTCWLHVWCTGPGTCYYNYIVNCGSYVTWYECRGITLSGSSAAENILPRFRYLADREDRQVQMWADGKWLPFFQTDTHTLYNNICPRAYPVVKRKCWTRFSCYNYQNCYFYPYYTRSYNYFNVYLNCPVVTTVGVLDLGQEITIKLRSDMSIAMDSAGDVRVTYGYYTNYLTYYHPYSGYTNYWYFLTYQFICDRLLERLETTTTTEAPTTVMSTTFVAVADPGKP